MLFEEGRKRQMSEYVRAKEIASVQELAELFHVSESTIRRDLKDLEEAGQLKRTHGGAVFIEDDNLEPPFVEKEDRFRLQKEAIARAAAKMIKDGDTILLDSGSTTYFLAKELKTFQRLTVVTNSIMVAQQLANQKEIELILTGGSLRHSTLSMVGPIAERTIESVRVDKAFLAINGVDPISGLTTPNMGEAEMKRKMMQVAGRTILLFDHSKYGKRTFGKVADFTEVDCCITDWQLSDTAAASFRMTGIELILAAEKENGK
jgi:DeoR family fructose operon transcriptional repressor